MRLLKMVILAMGIAYAGVSLAQRTQVDMEVGTAMQVALQKEIYGILISDSDEVQAEYKSKDVMYKNEKLVPFQEMFNRICKRDKADACPDVYFTKRTEQGIASMYPNGVLVINEDIVSRINENEAAFLLAHEYAHYKFNHSKQRMVIIANSVVENSYMVREPEQALAYAGMFKGVKEAHYDYENQADAYGFAYVMQYGLKIECAKMFARIAGGAVVSNDKHDSVEKRCTQYKD